MVLATLALGLIVPAAITAPSFADWAKSYGKVYSSKEELVVRRSIYSANVAKAAAHNTANNGWTMVSITTTEEDSYSPSPLAYIQLKRGGGGSLV